MATYTSPLDRVRVAAPCSADWERMTGDAQIRFCDQCSLNVYNLSGMTKREAEALITSSEGRLCVRFYRRTDGTILTENCPVGLRALKRRASRIANATISSIIGFLSGFGINLMFASNDNGNPFRSSHTMGDIAVVEESLGPRPVKETEPVAIAGMMEITPQTPDEGWTKGEMAIKRNKARPRQGRK